MFLGASWRKKVKESKNLPPIQTSTDLPSVETCYHAENHESAYHEAFRSFYVVVSCRMVALRSESNRNVFVGTFHLLLIRRWSNAKKARGRIRRKKANCEKENIGPDGEIPFPDQVLTEQPAGWRWQRKGTKFLAEVGRRAAKSAFHSCWTEPLIFIDSRSVICLAGESDSISNAHLPSLESPGKLW